MSITIRKGTGTPTTNTAGFIGEIYEDTNTGNRYECTGMYKTTGAKSYGPDCDYIWEKVDMIEEKRLPGNIGAPSVGVVKVSYTEHYDEENDSTVYLNQKLEYGDVIIDKFLESNGYNMRVTQEEFDAFLSFVTSRPCVLCKEIVYDAPTSEYSNIYDVDTKYHITYGREFGSDIFNVVNPEGSFM